MRRARTNILIRRGSGKTVFVYFLCVSHDNGVAQYMKSSWQGNSIYLSKECIYIPICRGPESLLKQ